MNAQMLQGRWNEIQGRIKEKWGQLSDQDLQAFEGNVDQLIGKIQEKTGESREAIESFLDRMLQQGQAGMASATERLQHATHYATDHLRSGYDRASDELYDRYEMTRGMVRDNPMQSVGTAFGVGVLVGVTLGLLFRQSR